MNTRLAVLLFFVIATTFMGVLITAALSTGLETGRMILLASASGFVLAIPASWAISRAMVCKFQR